MRPDEAHRKAMVGDKEWRAFLEDWARQRLAADKTLPASGSQAKARGASDAQIRALETRLGLALPPSYKAFLRASNGWGKTTAYVDRLRPANEVDWFESENAQWIEAYSIEGLPDDVPDDEYFAYGRRAEQFRREHLKRAVQISDVGDGVYLLIPDAVTSDGEWEAWFFANWIPGAHRYPSFAELMKAEYRSEYGGQGVPEPEAPYDGTAAPDRPRAVAASVGGMKRKKAKAPSIAELVASLHDPDVAARKRAATRIIGQIRMRDGTRIMPDLVDPLARALAEDPSADVRMAAASALGEFGDLRAVAPLCAALDDADPGVALSAIWSLGYHNNPAAVEPLCRFVERGPVPHLTDAAVTALGQSRDPRCLEIVLDVMRRATDVQSIYRAALAAAGLGPAATPALIELLKSDRATLRAAAAAVIQQTGDLRAIDPLRAALNDPDADVRLKAGISLQMLEAGVGGDAGGIAGAIERAMIALQAANQHGAAPGAESSP